MKLLDIMLIIVAVIALAVGDAFLKKAALEASLWRAIKSPWMMAAIALYLYQIVFVTYFFIAGWELSIVGTLQAAFYGLIVILAGIFYFGEILAPMQVLGIILVFSGVVLISAH